MPKVVITITLEDDGKVNVTGPLPDKILCYGLLSIAEDVIRNFNPNKVVVPSFTIPKDLKGN